MLQKKNLDIERGVSKLSLVDGATLRRREKRTTMSTTKSKRPNVKADLAADKALRAKVKAYMLTNARHHDNATSLAEDAAHNADDIDHDVWLNDESHWVWELALEFRPGE